MTTPTLPAPPSLSPPAVDAVIAVLLDADLRAVLAETANAAARASRLGGAPVLTADSDAAQLAAWLQWNDPNGCHIVDTTREGYDADFDPEPYDAARAWDVLAETLIFAGEVG